LLLTIFFKWIIITKTFVANGSGVGASHQTGWSGFIAGRNDSHILVRQGVENFLKGVKKQ
jgi:hypothetical protein